MTSPYDSRTCCGCGVKINGDSVIAHCLRCLMELGLEEHEMEPRFQPRRFGDYELLEQLGRGGMGVVYRARQVSLNRTVALKMLLDSQHDSPIAIRRFQIEAEAAARLSHPHIVPIHEIGDEGGQCFFSMQLVDGTNLAQLMARQRNQTQLTNQTKSGIRQTHRSIAQLVSTIARAVHYAHSHGVLHRDLKPANILVDASGKPHLTDFGLAKLADTEDRLSMTGAALGTPSYMAPEQAGGGRVSASTDVYSLGVILFEFLVGRLPFTAPTPMELLQKITTQDAPKLTALDKSIDLDLETVCLKCLEKDPRRRYASAELLAEDLERWLRGEPIMARPAGPAVRTIRWIRRNPVVTGLIASLFLGLIASLYLVKTRLDLNTSDTKLRLAEGAAENAHYREIEATKHTWNLLGVHEFWTDPEDRGLVIPSEFRAWVADISKSAPITPKVERYQIGMLLEEKDAQASIISYAHLLNYLERALSNEATTVRLDIRVYKKKESGINALENGDVDFLKIGGMSFVSASAAHPGINVLVGQHPVKTGVIFVSKGSGIDTLADLNGRTIAVGDSYSTLALWAIYRLTQAGVSPTYSRTLRPAKPSTDPKAGKSASKNVNDGPIHAVLSHGADAGVINKKLFNEANSDDLVILDTYPSSPVLWLAGSKPPPAFATKLAEAMVNLGDKSMFEKLSDKVESYKRVSEEDVMLLRAAVESVKREIGEEAALDD
jgi:serine/threonine protein kinase/ABC-type phosphate/phosphonate transport system substrate-binding protein